MLAQTMAMESARLFIAVNLGGFPIQLGEVLRALGRNAAPVSIMVFLFPTRPAQDQVPMQWLRAKWIESDFAMI
jgi:hypothetical protein